MQAIGDLSLWRTFWTLNASPPLPRPRTFSVLELCHPEMPWCLPLPSRDNVVKSRNIPPGTLLPGTGTSEFHPGQLITSFRSKAVAIYKANVFVKGLRSYFSPGPALTIAGLHSCLCLDIGESCGDGSSELPSCPACFSHVLGFQACTFWVTMFLFCFDHTTRFPLYHRVLVVQIICTYLVLCICILGVLPAIVKVLFCLLVDHWRVKVWPCL